LKKFFALTLLAFAISTTVLSQRKNEEYKYYIKKTIAPIEIDGVIDPAWSAAQTATNFNMVLPMDTSKAFVRTEVKMAYDSSGLYIITINYIDPG